MTPEITTDRDDLIKFIKNGFFFNFCVAFALNKGFGSVIKEKREVKFSVGDYDVTFDHHALCFILIHKIYFARIITTYLNGETIFIGDDEQEVIIKKRL